MGIDDVDFIRKFIRLYKIKELSCYQSMPI